VITDGVEALRRLDKSPIPTLVLLDLHCRMSRRRVLAHARVNPSWKDVPIYIITADAKLAEGYQWNPRGANGTFLKGNYSIDLLQELLEKYVQS